MKVYFILLLVFLFGCHSSELVPNNASFEKQKKDVFQIIQEKPDWLFPIDTCPEQIIPPLEQEINYLSEGCKDDPLACLEKCKSADGNACYALALHLQELKGLEQNESEALFQRSCKLGIISGCTNRAAFKMNAEPENPEVLKCSADTFEKTCERNDPWGCTMYALTLSQGIGRQKSLDMALTVLDKSCKYGEEDPACQEGNKIKEQIKIAKSQK
jgi:hypothetical protein